VVLSLAVLLLVEMQFGRRDLLRLTQSVEIKEQHFLVFCSTCQREQLLHYAKTKRDREANTTA
jgi:hypothetical protein